MLHLGSLSKRCKNVHHMVSYSQLIEVPCDLIISALWFIQSVVFHDDNAAVPSHTAVNKRPRITPLMHLFPERGEGSSLQVKFVI
jgi:hypothetical protein